MWKLCETQFLILLPTIPSENACRSKPYNKTNWKSTVLNNYCNLVPLYQQISIHINRYQYKSTIMFKYKQIWMHINRYQQISIHNNKYQPENRTFEGVKFCPPDHGGPPRTFVKMVNNNKIASATLTKRNGYFNRNLYSNFKAVFSSNSASGGKASFIFQASSSNSASGGKTYSYGPWTNLIWSTN